MRLGLRGWSGGGLCRADGTERVMGVMGFLPEVLVCPPLPVPLRSPAGVGPWMKQLQEE